MRLEVHRENYTHDLKTRCAWHQTKISNYLLVGRRDDNTPFELAVAWAAQLSAPKVDVVWLVDVARVAPLEDREAFRRELIERVLAETPPSA